MTAALLTVSPCSPAILHNLRDTLLRAPLDTRHNQANTLRSPECTSRIPPRSSSSSSSSSSPGVRRRTSSSSSSTGNRLLALRLTVRRE